MNVMNSEVEIKNIISGMKNVTIVGRIFRISSIVEFKRSDGTKGKVVNLFIGDYTGSLKLPLWDNQVKLIEEDTIKLGDMIRIENVLARESIYGGIEVTFTKYGNISPIDDMELPTVDELNRKFLSGETEKTLIKNLVPGTFEISGNIVNVIKTNFIFNTCSVCGNSVKESDGKVKCIEHGDADINPALVINTIVDDGSGNVRTVFFRNIAERACGINADNLAKFEVDKRFNEICNNLIGRELVLTGRAKKNKLFDRMEFIVNDFKDLNTLNESKKLIDTIELKVVDRW